MADERRIWTGIEGQLLRALDAREYPFAPMRHKPPRAPRWPSGIAGIDDNVHAEGFYGLSVVCGPPKLGKSMIAYRSALAAAMNGWQVIYVDAELDDWQATERLFNATKTDSLAWCEQYPNFIWRQLAFDVTLATLVEDIVAHVKGQERVLVVLDSIQRVAERLIREDGAGRRFPIEFFEALRVLTGWAMTSRRMTRGAASFLITSERNQRGGTKGSKLEHACDLLLKLKGRTDERVVELEVDLSREGGAGKLGKYVREFENCRFTPLGDRPVQDDQESLPSGTVSLDDWMPDKGRLL